MYECELTCNKVNKITKVKTFAQQNT